jgi:hypothetical protein
VLSSRSRRTHIFDFAYNVSGERVVQTETRRSDGTWTRLRYGEWIHPRGSWGSDDYQPLTFQYERDPLTNIVTTVALTCPDRKGHAAPHPAVSVRPESEEWIKWDLVRTVCSCRRDRWRQPR